MKQKIFTILLTFALSVGTVFASVTIDGIAYDLDVTHLTASVTSGGNYRGSIVIPESISYDAKTYSVTSIGEYAFYECTSLTSVTIPNSVTSIGGYAFRDCTGLTSVTIPNSVTSISGSPFYGCTGLTSPVYNAHIFAFLPTSYFGAYTIPSGIESLAGDAFSGCTSLTSVTIPNSVTSIGNSAFRGCTGLTSVTIPNSVIEIGWGAFSGCTSLPIIDNIRYADTYLIEASDKTLSTYTIKEGTRFIGRDAFFQCTSLTSITIPNSVTSIGASAFYGCTGLTAIDIPNSVTSIGASAFNGCTGLTAIDIPNSVTSIDDFAFYKCYGLTSITIPSSVIELYYLIGWREKGEGGFENYEQSNYNLKEVNAPASFFNVMEPYWSKTPKSLEKVVINSGELTDNALGVIARSNKTLTSLDISAVSNATLADEAFKDFYNLNALILPQNLTSISYMAVAGCVHLKDIDIPASVEEIDDRAFENCRSLETITFGGKQPSSMPSKHFMPATESKLKRIGNWAFYNAHELQHLEIPEGVEEIGDAAFYGCTYLEDLVLPKSIRSIGDNTFALCSKMQKIVVNAPIPPTIHAKTFYDVARQIPVYVPDEVIADYQADALWGEFNIHGISTMHEAIENTSFEQSNPQKFILNGTLYILLNGKMYTVQGTEVQ